MKLMLKTQMLPFHSSNAANATAVNRYTLFAQYSKDLTQNYDSIFMSRWLKSNSRKRSW